MRSLIFLAATLFPWTFVYAQEAEVNINASVNACLLDITVHPEKRIPDINHWMNLNTISLFSGAGIKLFEDTFQADNQGLASLDLCSQNVFASPGEYSIYVKGFSHLGRRFNNQTAFLTYQTNLNLSSPELLAGDTLDHNYINGLDLNNTISKLYTDDLKTDFNRDGIVNSLDLSNQLFNLHKSGDK